MQYFSKQDSINSKGLQINTKQGSENLSCLFLAKLTICGFVLSLLVRFLALDIEFFTLLNSFKFLKFFNLFYLFFFVCKVKIYKIHSKIHNFYKFLFL
ncbi:hypothetical protein DMC01_05265 [Campylobacter troglodytis]|nr:hypothetical protein DMC01_05265 [Campylobacter troglodytis]